jgi:hypothetical protein
MYFIPIYCNKAKNFNTTTVIENADIARFIKGRRIAWLGHVMRMDDKRTSKRVLEWKPIGMRIRKDQGGGGLRAMNKICK